MTNTKIAVAVALALGTVTAAHAAPPSVTACETAAPGAQLYVAGSSAAQAAFGDALATGLFGGPTNMLSFSATKGNFVSYCGTAASGAVVPQGTLIVVHYRGEGGSVTGALPIVANKAIKFLDMTTTAFNSALGTPANNAAGTPVYPVTTVGDTGVVGTTDGFTGPLTTHLVELGVTDVEPGQFFNLNYPKDYSTTVFGTATQAQLAGLSKRPLFGQVFGLAVNKTGLTLTGGTVDLSKQSAANILLGNYGDWSAVPNANGQISTGQAITVVNREEGSGTRTGASIYFLGTQCGAAAQTGNAISDPGPDQFSTGDALALANSTTGGITYASIDQLPSTKYPNLVFATINGQTPSNLAAANGDYDFWFEAQLITGAAPANANGPALLTYIYNTLPTLAGAPKVKDILAIPGVPTSLAAAARNKGTYPLTASGIIYTNPFTRSSNSCAVPSETN